MAGIAHRQLAERPRVGPPGGSLNGCVALVTDGRWVNGLRSTAVGAA
jgi:hypothetical protein